MHWSGGNENSVNLVLKKLMQTYGKEKGVEIYAAFNQALLAIAKDESPFKTPLSCLVMYKRNDNTRTNSITEMTKPDQEIYSET